MANSKRMFQLLSKEWRDLMEARSFWLMLVMIGPLVGHSFITSINVYAEASGINGAAAALPQGLTPLNGILVPTLGAYDLAATFLFPFVAIRVIAAERQSGALKLLLQLPGKLTTKVAAKSLVLLLGWLVALAPGILAIILWKFYGGHLYAPETFNLLFGHLLRAMLSAGVAVAAAAVTESAASAAIVTLGFTVGTWALEFVGAYKGGWLQQLAAYTPTAALRTFEQGLLQVSTTIVVVAVSVSGFVFAAIWLHTGRTWKFRLLGTAILIAALGTIIFGATAIRTSWDLSEDRRSSFSRADEAALRSINQPLRITVFLAPEDPRLADFEQNVLRKLRRVLPRIEIRYSSTTTTGLFESASDHYGEVWYEMNGQRVMERSAIDQVVLETIYKLGAVNPPPPSNDTEYPGYPLAARPRRAALIFYVLWPLFTILVWWRIRR